MAIDVWHRCRKAEAPDHLQVAIESVGQIWSIKFGKFTFHCVHQAGHPRVSRVFRCPGQLRLLGQKTDLIGRRVRAGEARMVGRTLSAKASPSVDIAACERSLPLVDCLPSVGAAKDVANPRLDVVHNYIGAVSLHIVRIFTPDKHIAGDEIIVVLDSTEAVFRMLMETNFSDQPEAAALHLGYDFKAPRELADRKKSNANLTDDFTSAGGQFDVRITRQ